MPEESAEKKTLDSYFRNIDKYSPDHLEDISRFSRLLESLKKDSTKNEEVKKHIPDIHDRIYKFNSLVEKYRLELSESEIEDIESINSSEASAPLKLRMLEDLFHKIRKNHKDEIDASISSDHLKEIEELRKKRSFFRDWFNLFIFALNYRTITPFSHNIKGSSLSVIKKDLLANILSIKDSLRNFLDREYYIFTIVEYNSLALILDLEDCISGIAFIESYDYCNPEKLREAMYRFCDIYLKIIANSSTIDAVATKLSSKRKMQHGFYGHIRSIIDQPLQNGKPVKFTTETKLTETVTGTLQSYYTSLEKKIITSLYQIEFMLNINTAVNIEKKNLTESASELETLKHEQKSSEVDRNERKYRNLHEIFDTYIPLGRRIAENIFREETFSVSESWHKNYENSPLYRPLRLVESLIKHFTERISTTNSIIFRYDNREFPRFFEHRKELFNAARAMSTADLELTSSNLKEMLDIDVPANVHNDNFISWVSTEEKLSAIDVKRFSQVRAFIQNIQSRVFSLASLTHDAIEKYENQKEINFPLVEENYNFFSGAEIAAHRQLILNKITGADPVTAENFLKSLCALCYYIAETFASPALKDLMTEESRLDNILSLENTGQEIEVENTSTVFVKKNELDPDEDHVTDYTDSITGLLKFRYFTDVLKPAQYTDSDRYKLGDIRYLIFIEIQNFQEINNRMGLDIGDRMLVKCCRILLDETHNRGRIDLFRYKNANIFGIYSTLHISEVISYIQSAASKINKLSANTEQYTVKNIFINCGIYEERKTCIFSSTFEITRRLMHSGSNKLANNIVMIKNRDIKINKKDFLPNGSINPALLKNIQ